MKTQKYLFAGILWIAIGSLPCAPSYGQAPPPPPPGGRGGPPPIPPDKRLAMQLPGLLGMSDQEWSAIDPAVERIQTLLKQRDRVMKPRPPRPPPPNDPNAPPPPPDPQGNQSVPNSFVDLRAGPDQLAPSGSVNAQLADAYIQLAEVAGDSSASSDNVQRAMSAFRAAMQDSDAELAQARMDLRQLVTSKQEAVLVVMGILN